MTNPRAALAEWVGREILPHEHDLRTWLQRRLITPADVEDIVQECYCRLAQLTEVSHITQPRAYLFTMARNLVHQQRRSAAVVRLEAYSAVLEEQLESSAPGPERIAAGRQEVVRLQAALATLSERARRIFVMRKIDGMSQRQIASTLGVSEAVVENDASRSLRTVLKVMNATDANMTKDLSVGGRHARSR
ncbi:RNA polymerase sigma factor [Sphingomonas xinjiangensis]|uniref:RNA polymerase sigma-70 factor (ECF subfamily) n=1 Tax=Sphingomonas xinjiangensis TaxID=643568 RepID=A0A840YS79_9SPHN|nr:RNA polymerase sigma factor [Sphingomonas xinjiangensis]MBB5712536.1 RNA polymerase sigma-70 factor (ECF subfamily) [Sphingomonas xinjiangensis]